jgi:hypothetical protein
MIFTSTPRAAASVKTFVAASSGTKYGFSMYTFFREQAIAR